jgi:hypothetical protein
MSGWRKFSLLVVALFALSAVGVASASAAEFTASEAGEVTGQQSGDYTFAFSSSGSVTCLKAHTTGTTATAGTHEDVDVVYSECTINVPLLGTQLVSAFTADYNLLASGSLEILNEFEVTVPVLSCSTKVTKGQTVGTVSYANVKGNTELEEKSVVTGIHSTSTGLCPSGTSGTLAGTSIVHRVGGGSVSFDS